MKFCITEFEAIANDAERGQHIALVCSDQSYTFTQLNAYANQIAHFLQRRALPSEACIGVYMSPTYELIATILAIWKGGWTYLPIPTSEDIPISRIQTYLSEAKPDIVLTELAKTKKKTVISLLSSNSTLIDLTSEFNIPHEDKSDLNVTYPVNQRAYIIYTSGSTGTPKGIEIEHIGLYNCFDENIKILGIKPTDRVAFFAQTAFDAHLMEIFISLLSGARLIVVPDAIKSSVEDLTNYYNEHAITVSILTPSMLRLLSPDKLPHMRIITSTGEVLDQITQEKWSALYIIFANGFGPSEVSICTSVRICYKLSPVDCGKPIRNLQVWIVTETGFAKVGEVGEVYITGIGLARGYLNNASLTAERFVELTISDQEKLRAFKSNDLGSLDADGNLFISGRKDRQIKIHGKLFHPAETESALLLHPLVKNAYVATPLNKHQIPIIIAYIHNPDRQLNNEDFRNIYTFLSTTLPHYMIPIGWVSLVEGNYALSKKFDWSKVVSEARPVSSIQHTLKQKPRDQLEQTLLEIWQDELGEVSLDDGIYDSFYFRGSSIQCTRFINIVNSRKLAQNSTVSTVEFFSEPTIANLARIIRTKNNAQMVDPIVKMFTSPNILQEQKPALFMIHSVLGDVESDYRKFVNCWDKSIDIYGIQCPGLERAMDFSCSLTEIAQTYCEAIRKIQSSGPYLIAGWSAGGLIGYAVVNQLQKMGEDAELIAIDIEFFSKWQEMSNSSHERMLIELYEKSILPFLQFNVSANELPAISILNNEQQIVTLFDFLISRCHYEKSQNKLSSIRNILLAILNYDYSHDFTGVHLFVSDTTMKKHDDSKIGWPDRLKPTLYPQKNADHFLMLDDTFCRRLAAEISTVCQNILLKFAIKKEVELIKNNHRVNFQPLMKLFVPLTMVIQTNKENYSFEDIQPPTQICISSPPLHGTSTIIKHLCYQWSVGKLWPDIELVLRFDMHDEPLVTHGSRLDMATLIRDYCIDHTYNKISDMFTSSAQFVEQQPEKVMIIVDNWQHASEHSPTLRLLKRILQRKNSNFIFVIKNERIPDLPDCLEINLQRLSTEKVNEYIKKYFRENKRLNAIAQYLIGVYRDISELIKSPFFCRLFCDNLKEQYQSGDPTDEKTVNKTMLLNGLIGKDWVNRLCEKMTVPQTPNSLEIAAAIHKIKSQLELFLEKIAFLTLTTNSEFVSTSHIERAIKKSLMSVEGSSSLLSNIVNSGLMYQIGNGKIEKINFATPLVKQWFSACYWVRKHTSAKKKDRESAMTTLKRFCNDSTFFTVWALVCGILKQRGLSHYEFLSIVFERVTVLSDLSDPLFAHFLYQCLHEIGETGDVIFIENTRLDDQKREKLLVRILAINERNKFPRYTNSFFKLAESQERPSILTNITVIGCKLQLPSFYKERSHELSKVRAYFQKNENVELNKFAVIHGPSGMGKSLLALSISYQMKEHYPGGIFWLDATSDHTLKNSWRIIANVFGIDDQLGYEDMISKLQIVLDKLEKSLFILDNVCDSHLIVDLLYFQLDTVKSAHNILITTESDNTKIWGEHCSVLLPKLDRAQSKEILTDILRQFDVTPLDVDSERLATTLCDWPFFLVQSAYTIKNDMSLAQYIDVLTKANESEYSSKLLLEQNDIPESFSNNKSALEAHLLTCGHIENACHGAVELLNMAAFYSESNIPFSLFGGYRNYQDIFKILSDYHFITVNISDETISISPMRKKLVLQKLHSEKKVEEYLLRACALLLNKFQITGDSLLDIKSCRLFLLNTLELHRRFENMLKTMPKIYSRILMYVYYYATYGVSNYKEVISLSKSTSIPSGNTLLSLTIENCLAHCYIYAGDFVKSAMHSVKAIEIYMNIREDMFEYPKLFIEQTLRMCMNTATLYHLSGNITSSIKLYDYFYTQLDLQQYPSHTAIDFLIHYGFVHAKAKNLDQAKDFYTLASNAIKLFPSDRNQTKLLYLDRCKADLQLDGYINPQKALKKYQFVEHHYLALYHENHNNLAVIARCIGDCHLLIGSPIDAIQCYQRALTIHVNNGFKAKGNLAVIYGSLIRAYETTKEYEKADLYRGSLQSCQTSTAHSSFDTIPVMLNAICEPFFERYKPPQETNHSYCVLN